MNERILIIDDDVQCLKLLSFLLRAHGYQVATAQDARAAARSLAESRPALVLLDLRLPGVDGFVLSARIRSEPALRDVPIVALTASAVEGDRHRALAAGCDDYVTKPINTRTFPTLVARALQRTTTSNARALASR